MVNGSKCFVSYELMVVVGSSELVPMRVGHEHSRGCENRFCVPAPYFQLKIFCKDLDGNCCQLVRKFESSLYIAILGLQ